MYKKKDKRKSVVETVTVGSISSEVKRSSTPSFTLKDLQGVLHKASICFYSAFIENEETAASSSKADLCLIYYGSYLFVERGKKNATNTELVDEIKNIATLFFPYLPYPNKSLDYFFSSRKQYLCSCFENTKKYWPSYFFFLSQVIAEKNIAVDDRLTFLASVFEFFEFNKESFSESSSYYFIDELLEILLCPQTGKLLLEHKKDEKFSIETYVPPYINLFLNTINSFCESNDGQLACDRRERLTKAIETDRMFMKGNNLRPVYFFEKSLKKFSDFIPEHIDKYLPRDSRVNFFSKLSLLANGIHNLQKIFMTAILKNKIDEFYTKNDALIESSLLCGKGERKQIRADEQLKIETRKNKNRLRKTKKSKKDLNREIAKKEEKKFTDLVELMEKLSKSLNNAAYYVKQLTECSGVNVIPLIQKFKTEFGKLCAELKSSYDLLDLEISIPLDMPNDLKKLQAEFIKYCVDNKRKGLLTEKLWDINGFLISVERDRDALIKELNNLVNVVKKLQDKISASFKIIEHVEKITLNEIKQFNKCKNKVEILSENFYCYVTALDMYQKIIPVTKVSDIKFDKMQRNIESLEKIFKELDSCIKSPSCPKPGQTILSSNSPNEDTFADRLN